MLVVLVEVMNITAPYVENFRRAAYSGKPESQGLAAIAKSFKSEILRHMPK